MADLSKQVKKSSALTLEADVASFQTYQREFTQHIRNPKQYARPTKVPAKRMAVYTEIVYNNIEGTMAACFPVTKRILSARKWQQLMRGFLADYRASTPIFREIPQQLLQYIATHKQVSLKLPAYLPQLMHYEWVELALSAQDTRLNLNEAELVQPQQAVLGQIILTPAMYLLQYDYPVHQISPAFQPKKADEIPTYLLVFRNEAYQVQFMELNPITFELVAMLQRQSFTGEQALQALAAMHPHIAKESILTFGHLTLQTLKENGVIVGVKK